MGIDKYAVKMKDGKPIERDLRPWNDGEDDDDDKTLSDTGRIGLAPDLIHHPQVITSRDNGSMFV